MPGPARRRRRTTCARSSSPAPPSSIVSSATPLSVGTRRRSPCTACSRASRSSCSAARGWASRRRSRRPCCSRCIRRTCSRRPGSPACRICFSARPRWSPSSPTADPFAGSRRAWGPLALLGCAFAVALLAKEPAVGLILFVAAEAAGLDPGLSGICDDRPSLAVTQAARRAPAAAGRRRGLLSLSLGGAGSARASLPDGAGPAGGPRQHPSRPPCLRPRTSSGRSDSSSCTRPGR